AMMLADHVDGAVIIGQSIADGLPILAVVSRDVDVNAKVVAAMAIEGRISGAFGVARRNDAAHIGSLGHALYFVKDVHPVLAAIARYLKVAVVGAHPQQVFIHGGLADRSNGRPCLHTIMPRERVLIWAL